MGERFVADPLRGLIPASEFYANKYAALDDARSDLACPSIAIDTMEPVRSMLDGKMYDSKANLRATYKAAGVAEVGNDSSVVSPKGQKPVASTQKDVRASIEKAFSAAGLGA